RSTRCAPSASVQPPAGTSTASPTAPGATASSAGADMDDTEEPRVRVCFVCLGNICRSPTAEAVMTKLVQDEGLEGRIEVDSAGTAGYHGGDPRAGRSAAEAGRRGVPMVSVARRFHPGDLDDFDLVLAMDGANLADLHDLASHPDQRAKVRL